MTSAAANRFETEYRQRRAQAFLWRAVVLVVTAVAFYYSAVIAQFDLNKLVAGWPQMGKFFEEFFPHFKWDVIGADDTTEGSFAYWMYAWRTWSWALLQSVNMAILATIASVVSGFALAVVAARNMGMPVWLSFAAQRFGDLLRTLPDLVLALVFVVAFGIGPFAGLLAIWLHATGALTKLYAEVVENIDMNQIEGLRGAGASWLQRVRYGVIPQVLPNVASYGLLRFEINVGAAAAIGFVGGGGVGQEFVSAMQAGYLQEASAILAMIILVIFMIDLLSERIRHRLIGTIA
jgi:phosphonate transport system permease protein